jgi:hypothetical protein
VQPIKLLYHGFDPGANEHWTEENEAFLISDNMVVIYYEEEISIFKFPKSLAGRESVDYFPVDERVKRYAVHFEGFNRWRKIDLSKSLTEIICELSEQK